ncbi:MAG: MGMT family protein [Terrimicrobiaceae bacterium]|jgi:methylated-DNA-[protein]-cysteine S-methyltransferase
MRPARQPAKPITEFQRRIYEVLARVPRGCVTTYGALAAATSCASAQAVGQALRRNPLAPEIPCHRVVCANGSPGGFFGSATPSAMGEKRRLLEKEGVAFDGTGRVLEAFILREP